MNKSSLHNSLLKLTRDEKGATIVEYVMLLIVILVFCVGAYKTLASKVSTSATTTATSF
jgi:Flp pilus assembly pilin Flp